MPDLPERKVGIIACSGEELAEGTVTRLAALRALHHLRRGETVTICLPLFLAGGEGDRAFARVNPTITVDGCDLRCAARSTEKHSAKPAASIVVSELLAERGMARPEGRRRLDRAGREAVSVVAERIAALVDDVLRKEGLSPATSDAGSSAPPRKEAEQTCSCGSGIPVKNLVIDGKVVEVVALPLIFRKLREAGRRPDETTARELLDTVKIYNYVRPEAEASYRDAILGAYAEYCERESQP